MVKTALPRKTQELNLITAPISGDGGLTLTEYSAYGVIGSITPTTNPTETIINNIFSRYAGRRQRRGL